MESHVRWFLCGILYSGLKTRWLNSTERREMSDMTRIVIDHCFDQFFTLIIQGGYAENRIENFLEELNMLTNIINRTSQDM